MRYYPFILIYYNIKSVLTQILELVKQKLLIVKSINFYLFCGFYPLFLIN